VRRRHSTLRRMPAQGGMPPLDRRRHSRPRRLTRAGPHGAVPRPANSACRLDVSRGALVPHDRSPSVWVDDKHIDDYLQVLADRGRATARTGKTTGASTWPPRSGHG
jgi:hypothetical protein